MFGGALMEQDNIENISYESFMAYVEILKVIGKKESLEVINMLLTKMDLLKLMSIEDLEKLEAEIKRLNREVDIPKVKITLADMFFVLGLVVIMAIPYLCQ